MPTQNRTLFIGGDRVSVFAMSAFVALKEKRLAFDIATIDMKAQEQKRPAYREISLTSRIPTLIDGDLRLSESSAIAEYLEEAYPAPDYPHLYPREMTYRARARQLQAWLRSDLAPLRTERPADLFYTRTSVEPLSAAARTAADKLVNVATTLIGASTGNLFGAWSIADTDLATMLQRLALNGDALPDFLVAYAQRQWDRPSVRAWVDHPRTEN
jgi:glutathione S-transferase